MREVRKDILWRVYLMYGFILIFAGLIVYKIIHIQTVEKTPIIKEANKTIIRDTVEAIRGNIYASDKSILATSVPMFEIWMDVSSPLIPEDYFQKNVGQLAKELSLLFDDKSTEYYKNKLLQQRRKGSRGYLIQTKASYTDLKKLKTFPIFERGKFKGGLIVKKSLERKQPYYPLAARTIGYDRKDINKKVGIEGAFTEFLSGVKGLQVFQKISHGVYKPLYDKDDIDPKNGYDVTTTINVVLQDVADASLRNHLTELQGEWGCAVLMEVKTGYIRAIVNLEQDSSGNYHETYNHAIGTKIEPGSTFKLASIMALLEDQLIDLNDTIDIGNGTIKYFDRIIRDVHPIRDGRITIREAFEKSSNVGISKLIYKAYASKPSAFIDHLYGFSLNEKVGIDIEGERMPQIKTTKDTSWSAVSLPFMSIGYELMLTPIQILSFYNAIANDGKLVKPILVQEISEVGHPLKTFKTEILNSQICSQSTLKQVKELLLGVVENGTATFLSNSIYQIAGKTGTAQIATAHGYDKTNYNASFVGYFPADNPQYTCIVVVNKPKGKYYASTVAVPVIKNIADKVYATQFDIHSHERKNIPNPEYPLWAVGETEDFIKILGDCKVPFNNSIPRSDWAISLEGENELKLGNRIIQQNAVPNVIGMGARDAAFILENLGLVVKIEGKGHVKEQIPAAGNIIRKGSQIIIKLGI